MGPCPAQTGVVRFLVDISRDSDGRVAGRLQGTGGGPVPFSGWLELLRLLEDRTPLTGDDGGRHPGGGDLTVG